MLLVMDSLVSSVVHERSRSKSIMYKSLARMIDSGINLFTVYLDKLGESFATTTVLMIRDMKVDWILLVYHWLPH